MDKIDIGYEVGKTSVAVGGTTYAIAGLSYSDIAAIATIIFVVMQIIVFLPRFVEAIGHKWSYIKRKLKWGQSKE